MLPSIYFSDFFRDPTVLCTNLKNLDKMSKFEGTVVKTDLGVVMDSVLRMLEMRRTKIIK